MLDTGNYATEVHTPSRANASLTGATSSGDNMKSILAVVLCVVVPLAVFAGDISYKVTYDGGSLPELKTGTGMHLFIDQNNVRFVENGKEVATVPASAITEISYGQDVHRRVGAAIGLAVVSFGIGALMALTKSKKYFVGLTWADGDKKGGLAMQCDKNEYRGILAGLEGISGKKAVDSSAMTVKN
jgi:CxxC motif-containing protein (DUF1111 family)